MGLACEEAGSGACATLERSPGRGVSASRHPGDSEGVCAKTGPRPKGP